MIFLRLIRKYILPNADIVAYCLMPNHFHFLLYTDEKVNERIKQGGIIIDPLTNGIRKLLSGYARSFNLKYHRSGSVFRQKTKYKCLTELNIIYTVQEYCCNCFYYVHQNPMAASLVTSLNQWEYSSYKDYAGLRNGSLCNKELAVKFCGYEASSFIKSVGVLVENKLDL